MKLYNENSIQNIANSIRENSITTNTNQYKVEDMALGITNMANDIKDTLYQYLPTSHSINGVCNNSVALPIKEGSIEGNSKQDGTPTPTNPIDIEVVEELSLKQTGKNLIPFTNQDFILNNVHYYVKNGSLIVNGTSTGETSTTNVNFINNFSFKLKAGTYSIVGNSTLGCYLKRKSDNSNVLSNPSYVANTRRQFTLNEETELYLGFYIINQTLNNLETKLMIYEGIESTSYEPYKSKTTPINLNGNELARVGEIKDILRIYRSGKVEIEKKIGKIASYNGETITTNYLSTTRQLTNGATIYYILNTPQTIELPSIDPIETYDGTTIFNLISNLETNFDIEFVESV